MRFSRIFSSAAALAFVQAVLASDVLDLTTVDFESTVNPESLILVEFFAPWYVPFYPSRLWHVSQILM